jgi:tyrosine decarboxylase/aspartate 1-decarboxylase
VWGLAKPSASASSAAAEALFDAAAAGDLHLAKLKLPRALAEPWAGLIQWDLDALTVMRSVLMKPEHAQWTAEIWKRLVAAL